MSFKENLKNELVYNDIKVKELANETKWALRGSNPRHSGCKPDARTS